MTNVYPVVPGLGFSVFKTPQFKNRVQKSVSGRELRVADQVVPTWEFKLKYDFLRDNSDQRQGAWGTILGEMRELLSFFVGQQGQLTPFLFDDPTDDTVIGLGTPTGVMNAGGDGATTTFQLERNWLGTLGTPAEAIIAPNTVSHAYVNGVDPGGWTVNFGTGQITFGTPPGAAAILTWEGTFYFLVRFADDNLSFEYFMYQLWQLGEVKLQSVLL